MQESPAMAAPVEFQYFELTIFSDGSIHRAPFDPPPVPPCPSPSSPNQVASKDLTINAPHPLPARLFLPPCLHHCTPKLPILLYLYGGTFFKGSSTLPPHHHFLCRLAQHANVLILSIDYRLLPEHPFPAAFEDGFQGLLWLEEQATLGMAGESWLASYGDFDRCFVMGDSSGSTLVHYVAMQAAGCKPWGSNADAATLPNLKHVHVQGMILAHPFFTCGRGGTFVPEIEQKVFKYGKIKSTDDPLADPFCRTAPSLANVHLPRALVFVAGKDPLKNRGVAYHRNLTDAGKDVSIVLHDNEHHGFHILTPESPNVVPLLESPNVVPLLDTVRDFIHL